MKISVCFIVKNEEKVFENCLNCVKKFADEIVVVDTGSKDKTKQIAKKFTNKIYDFEWKDDFSAARNFSFSKATCEYIMWLDADDFITEENIKKILKLKQQNSAVDAFIMRYETVDFYGNSFVFSRERILKKSCGFVWVGFVHEAIPLFGRVEELDITIHHHKKEKTNKKRNYLIYKKHLKIGYVFNAREQYYYAKELFYLGRYKSAMPELKKYLAMHGKLPANIFDATLSLARCYKYLRKYEKSLGVFFECIKQFGLTNELLCEVADVFLIQENYLLSELFYNQALNYDSKLNFWGVFENKIYENFYPKIQLFYLYKKSGNTEKSEAILENLKKEFPDNEVILRYEKMFKE